MKVMCNAASIAAGIVFTVLSAPGLAGTSVTFEAVGPLEFTVGGMSADGSVIVGDRRGAAPSFRWTRESGGELIGGDGGGTSVSRDGTSITANVTADGHKQAALWLGGTEWQPLGGLSSEGCPDLSGSFGINGDGSVVVGLGWDGCQARAFRWEESTGMVDLGSLTEGRSSRANGINADGSVIVGWDDAENGNRRGARWVDGVESLLSDNTNPAIFLGEAQAVSADGSVIVGGPAGPVTGMQDQAFIWTEAQGGQLIGNLGSGTNFSAIAFVVSDDGLLVGGGSGGQFRDAFLWTEQTGMIKLADFLTALGVTAHLGWDRLDSVDAMSADGSSIAGWGINDFGRVQGWLVENLPPFTDSDNDGVLDALDNCSDVANEAQRDTDGDGFGNFCDPDFNNDLTVNFLDVGLMKSVFFTADEHADLDGDGTVDFVDLGILKSYVYGPPGPSGQTR